MSVREIERSHWTKFFDSMTRALVGKRAELEVASLEIGDQVQAEWVLLHGITYDHKNNLIGVALEGLEHLILVPEKVYVDYLDGDVITIAIIDAHGTRQILKLKDPLALPAPAKLAGAER